LGSVRLCRALKRYRNGDTGAQTGRAVPPDRTRTPGSGLDWTRDGCMIHRRRGRPRARRRVFYADTHTVSLKLNLVLPSTLHVFEITLYVLVCCV